MSISCPGGELTASEVDKPFSEGNFLEMPVERTAEGPITRKYFERMLERAQKKGRYVPQNSFSFRHLGASVQREYCYTLQQYLYYSKAHKQSVYKGKEDKILRSKADLMNQQVQDLVSCLELFEEMQSQGTESAIINPLDSQIPFSRKFMEGFAAVEDFRPMQYGRPNPFIHRPPPFASPYRAPTPPPPPPAPRPPPFVPPTPPPRPYVTPPKPYVPPPSPYLNPPKPSAFTPPPKPPAFLPPKPYVAPPSPQPPPQAPRPPVTPPRPQDIRPPSPVVPPRPSMAPPSPPVAPPRPPVAPPRPSMAPPSPPVTPPRPLVAPPRPPSPVAPPRPQDMKPAVVAPVPRAPTPPIARPVAAYLAAPIKHTPVKHTPVKPVAARAVTPIKVPPMKRAAPVRKAPPNFTKVSVIKHADKTTNIRKNRASLVAYPDGRAVVTHGNGAKTTSVAIPISLDSFVGQVTGEPQYLLRYDNGSETIHKSDGTGETKHKDGAKTVHKDDHSAETIHKDGTLTQHNENDTAITHQKDGTKVEHKPDGSKLFRPKEHRVGSHHVGRHGTPPGTPHRTPPGTPHRTPPGTPHARPHHGGQHHGPQYRRPHHAPQHHAPQHHAPQHHAPQHHAPQHHAPQHRAPQHGARHEPFVGTAQADTQHQIHTHYNLYKNYLHTIESQGMLENDMLDLRKDMMDYGKEKNRAASNLLGVYAFLNLSAIGILIYLFRSKA